MNENDMAGFKKRRYKIRGVGKRKYRIRCVGKRRQYKFRGLSGIDRDRLGRQLFSFWGRADPSIPSIHLEVTATYIDRRQKRLHCKERRFPQDGKVQQIPDGKKMGR